MTSFRKANKQAQHAIAKMLNIGSDRHTNRNDQKIHSLGTRRNYTAALTRLTQWLQKNKHGDLKSLNQETALHYLELRGQRIGQKLLDQERQAIQLYLKIKLPVIQSELTQALKSRAYTAPQVALIAQGQTEKYRLATQIAYAAGLRAHELLTLRRAAERGASTHRKWLTERFTGRQGERYTVMGKGDGYAEHGLRYPLIFKSYKNAENISVFLSKMSFK